MQRLNEASPETLVVDQMTDGGWIAGRPGDFNASYALDIGELAAFVAEAQPNLVEVLGLTVD